jgi:putative PIN family toxin of toxin-antitoxin system
MSVVFDTNTVISALLFRGKLSVLVEHWQQANITPLICEKTRAEFLRVLAYPKLKLSQTQIDNLASYYLPYTKTIEFVDEPVNDLPVCRDNKDQIFLELAYLGKADILITGDLDLLVLKEQTPFKIMLPIDYLNDYL